MGLGCAGHLDVLAVELEAADAIAHVVLPAALGGRIAVRSVLVRCEKGGQGQRREIAEAEG